jgi:dipeptidyl aminopeptidase/acylaminoacyl peptidase
VVLRDLWWLGTRLAGYRGRRWTARDIPDGELLAEEPAPAIPRHPEIEVRRLRYASDGLAVTAYALWPRRAEEALPIVLYGRGGLGPHGVVGEEDLDFLAELADGGPYLVLATQYRGNDGGEGEDRAGHAAARDLKNLRHLAERLPGADPTRCGVVGFSRGGTMAFMAHREGLRPDAIATIGCVTDLEQAFEEGDILLRSAIRVSTGGRPAKRRREAYQARSPRLWAEDIEAPCLLMHGDEDEVIRVTQSQRLAARLAELGKPYELVVVEGGDHKLLTHKDRRRTAVLAYLAEHLV